VRAAAEFIARSAGTASRLLGRGGGTSLPGTVLLKLRPNAVADLAASLGGGSLTVSATNGKTTTSRLIVAGLDAAGVANVANTAGANLMGGVASTLLAAQLPANNTAVGVLEVDEAALPAVVTQAQPRVITLINLFRDQLDRFGELETLLATWASMISTLDESVTLVLNADDPAVASLAAHHENVVWFGIEDRSMELEEMAHAADSTRCRICTTELVYDAVMLGHLGHWACPTNDTARPPVSVAVTGVTPRGTEALDLHLTLPTGEIHTRLQLPGLHNAYNAAAAAATLTALGVDAKAIENGLGAAQAAFGRAERLTIDGKELVLFLAKNPTGANTNVRTVLQHDGPLHVLAMLNDRTADGQDVSWIWDVDYEPLLERVAHITVAGDRAHDLALRFHYAGLDANRLTIAQDPARALDSALQQVPAGNSLFALPTYTAMLDLRAVLTQRGHTDPYWETAS